MASPCIRVGGAGTCRNGLLSWVGKQISLRCRMLCNEMLKHLCSKIKLSNTIGSMCILHHHRWRQLCRTGTCNTKDDIHSRWSSKSWAHGSYGLVIWWLSRGKKKKQPEEQAEDVPVDVQWILVDIAHLADKGLPKRRAHRNISLQNVLDVSHDLSLPENVWLCLCLVDDFSPRGVWRPHQPLLQANI